MAANASINVVLADSHDNESRGRKAFASLATLFEKNKSDTELGVIERDQLANRFELQLSQLTDTLDASSFGQFPLQLFQFLSLMPSCYLDCLIHSGTKMAIKKYYCLICQTFWFDYFLQARLVIIAFRIFSTLLSIISRAFLCHRDFMSH